MHCFNGGDVNEDILGLRLLCLYGLKGAAAYMEHARVLDQTDVDVAAEFHKIMAFLGEDSVDADKLFATGNGNRPIKLPHHGDVRFRRNHLFWPS